MYKVYKITEALLPVAAARNLRTAARIMLIVYALFSVYLLIWLRLGFKDILIGGAVYIPACCLALFLGYFLLKQNYRHYRIVLDDEGILFTIPRNDKKIKWADLKIIDHTDGITELNDIGISSFVRWLTGEGNIKLLPEIEHVEELLIEIRTHSA